MNQPDPVADAITCLIADDHEVVREGLRLALSRAKNVRVVGEATDGESAVVMAQRRRPDVVMMDLRMGGIDGIEAAREIRRTNPRLPRRHLHRPAGAQPAPARPRRRLLAATCSRRRRTRPSCGPSSASPPATSSSIRRSPRRSPPRERDTLLTNREKEILQLLADGMSNDEVATKLFISQETVKSHVRHILAKLEADTRTQAVAIALRDAIIA